MNDPEERAAVGLPRGEEERGQYMVELNLLHREGLEGAERRFRALLAEVTGHPAVPEGAAVAARARVSPAPHRATRIATTYYRCLLSVVEWRELARRDGQAVDPKDRAIYRIWPDFPIRPLIDRSVATVKGDAAGRSYDATGDGITWAIIDSGIDGRHAHFATYDTLGGAVAGLHRDFTGEGKPGPETAAAAQVDAFGHGTHVAGIVAGGLPAHVRGAATKNGKNGKSGRPPAQVFEKIFAPDEPDRMRIERRTLSDESRLRGVAPRCKLVSLKVLDEQGGGRASDVMRALQYVREELNGDGKLLRVHGVNISLGYEFDAEWFACGQSPLCVEVDRLVRSGVVVVVAAGNTGYGRVGALERQSKTALTQTINDPGNAAMAITVGATHRDSPHTYGVSYFSSKGPTGDGRLKPDIVAPGERITSCATGARLEEVKAEVPEVQVDAPVYVDHTGTSMAAPHVSGAVAAFLSIRREFIQRPEEVKRIFLDSATPLGRERYFEGHGLVDLMRAIQSV